MPAFLNKVFKRDNAAAIKKAEAEAAAAAKPVEVKYADAWFRTSVTPEDVQELLRGCTNEIKHRGLSTPFLLLPFRPNSDPSAARTFIRNFFDPATGPLRGEHLQQELRLTEPVVLCSTLKWCWSRLPGGVVTWDVYELFRQGEVDSSMARDSFATFIPISSESEARSRIIFDFFDLISAIAAHGKHNGLGGMKLSRLAGWWAFEHSDGGWGFEGGYASWSRAADATAHMFFAYLRSLSPAEGVKGVSILPISLKALLASIDYPPTAPSQLQSPSVRVVMTVDNVSPTPFALLRRAKNFSYDEREKALQIFMQYEDPVQALTDECKRVMRCISSTNQSSAGAFKASTGLQEQSWSRFQDIGFSGLSEEQDSDSEGDADGLSGAETFRRRRASTQPATPRGGDMSMDLARPTTPSWADFMQSGFGERDQGSNGPRPLLLPPDKVLPPIDTDSRVKTSASHRRMDESMEPGELSSVSPMNVDDAFWWVWMSSLAGEEPTQRKAVFGRCALVETVISGGRWLIVEEKVKGAAVKPDDALLAKDKKKSMRSMLTRRKSIGHSSVPVDLPAKFDPSIPPPMQRTRVGPDQAAKIQVAAAALRQQQAQLENSHMRSPTGGQRSAQKTNSVFTLQPVIMSEATPAMKWASKYDRDAIRDAYLNGLPLPDGNAPSRPVTERSLPALPTEDDDEREEQRLRPVSMIPPPKDRPEPISKNEPVNRRPTNKPAPISKVTQVLPSPTSAPMNHPALSLPSPTTNGRISPALQSPPLSPPSQNSRASTSSTPEKTKKANRFKSFFTSSKKVEPATTDRTSPQPIEMLKNSNLAAPSTLLGRKPSMSKKKTNPIEFKAAVSAPVTPIIPTSNSRPKLHDSGSSNPGSEEVRVATQAFSSFDQGPLPDQPAFVPDSPAISEPPTPVSEHIPMMVHEPIHEPVHESVHQAIHEPVYEVGESIAISEESALSSPEVIPVQDRWAQIRRNAAERAKAPVQAEEFSDARGSIDDGETSGEETIESRVARIKARVAELTGNMEANRV